MRRARWNAAETGAQGVGSGSSPSFAAEEEELFERRVAGQRGGPGVGQQVRPLQGGQFGQAVGQGQPVLGFVAHPEHAPSTGIDDGQALRGLFEVDRGLVEDELAGGRTRLPVGGQSPHGDRDVPRVTDGRLDPVGDLAVGERLLLHGVAAAGRPADGHPGG